MYDKSIMLQEFLYKLYENECDKKDCKYENPYTDESSIQRYNLENYLHFMLKCEPTIMLVGEAPGYKGCQKTGIPFVSENELINPANMSVLGEWERRADQGNEVEKSAQYVMEALRIRYDKDGILPLLWNSFPYHPYKGENKQTNRTPSSDEIIIGKTFVEELKKIFEIKDENVYAIGRRAQKSLGMLKNYHYIRHPSYGGKDKCQDYIITYPFL